MSGHPQHRHLLDTVAQATACLAVTAIAASLAGEAAYAQPAMEPVPDSAEADHAILPAHMSETLRASVDKLVIIAGPTPAGRDVTGSYEKDTAGLIGGMDAGARATTISKDIGPVPVNFPIPIIKWPAAIIGGIAGTTQREIQEFRDALTEDLAQAADEPLTNLASDIYFALQKLPNMETRVYAATTPVPKDTDAILYVNFDSLTIDVQGKEAILTTSAVATLRRLADGWDLHKTKAEYQDRDSLANWTADDNALWHAYANFARHYLAREISAEVFDRVELKHELAPTESDSVARVKKNDWHGTTKSTTPTLAWELTLLGGDSYGGWADAIDEADIFYDVEIYDARSLVYAEQHVADPSHALLYELEPCNSYRWSVRPNYRVGSDIKYGEWMRSAAESDDESDAGNGNVGRQASIAPAYTQDFAVLDIACGRK